MWAQHWAAYVHRWTGCKDALYSIWPDAGSGNSPVSLTFITTGDYERAFKMKVVRRPSCQFPAAARWPMLSAELSTVQLRAAFSITPVSAAQSGRAVIFPNVSCGPQNATKLHFMQVYILYSQQEREGGKANRISKTASACFQSFATSTWHPTVWPKHLTRTLTHQMGVHCACALDGVQHVTNQKTRWF